MVLTNNLMESLISEKTNKTKPIEIPKEAVVLGCVELYPNLDNMTLQTIFLLDGNGNKTDGFIENVIVRNIIKKEGILVI